MNERACPHRYCGCISQNGYLCLNDGPCEPIDERGRWFAISYTMEHGQMFMHREYRPMPVAANGNKAVCGNRCMCQPEDHAGKGACGKIIDAEAANAALALVAQVRGRC
jgi:hypothetical protein